MSTDEEAMVTLRVPESVIIEALQQRPEIVVTTDNASPETPELVTDDSPLVGRQPRYERKERTRMEKPHVSLYLAPRVIEAVRDIAYAKGGKTKAHDIYIEGLRHILAAYGQDYDALSVED